MPVLEYQRDAAFRIPSLDLTLSAAGETIRVPDGWAWLADEPAFEESDTDDPDYDVTDAVGGEGESEGESEGFDVASFTDQGYRDRVAAVESGEVDDHLDEIEERDSSQNVQDAIQSRREELSEGEEGEE